MKRSLVVSVGGSRGAYAGGIIEYYTQNGRTYDSFYGSSVGSLVIPFAATGNYNQLKTAFNSVTMEDIFNLDPFKIEKQNNGVFKYTINYWNVFKSIFVNKQTSLGDSRKVRTDTIPKFFPVSSYIELLNANKDLTIMVTNISTGELEEKKLRDYTHSEFIDWMWASTCAPPFMSVATINGCDYTDGGIMCQVPIKQAILDGSDEVDVIILSKENNDWPIEHIRNPFHYNIKLLMLMMNKLMDYQIDLGYLSHHATKKVKVNFHFTKRRLTNNSLIFDKELMSKWWEEGYESVKNGEVKSYLIDGRNSTYSAIDS